MLHFSKISLLFSIKILHTTNLVQVKIYANYLKNTNNNKQALHIYKTFYNSIFTLNISAITRMMHKHNTCLFTCSFYYSMNMARNKMLINRCFYGTFHRLFVEEKDMIIGQLAVSQNLLLI